MQQPSKTTEGQRQQRIALLLNRIHRDTEELLYLYSSKQDAEGEVVVIDRPQVTTPQRVATAPATPGRSSTKKSKQVRNLERELAHAKAKQWARQTYGI